MNDPIFKAVFGKSWVALPPVMKKHYANRPFSNDHTFVKGTIDIFCKAPLIWLAPLLQVMGQIPAKNANNIPVTVDFQSSYKNSGFQFNRLFYFIENKPYAFRSYMLQIAGDEVIEVMRFGIGWKTRYYWDGDKIVLSHRGYAIKFFNWFLPLPFTLLLGKSYAEERAVDDNTFDMLTHITHPWWGKIYQYKGRFEVVN